ncbi:TolC family protein [candidate division KSB1 bacterium]|nr:TolC family protein [candidate division KSB1 bacterium]
MRQTHFLFLLVLLILTSVVRAENLTLQQCFELALANNPSLEIARIDVLLAREDEKQAGKEKLPSLNFSGSYRRQSEVPEIEIPPIETPFGQSITVFPEGGMTLGSLDTYDFKITLSQPVFTGFRLHNRQKNALALAENKQFDYDRKKSELLYNVETAYRNLQKTVKILAITQAGEKQVELHLKDVQNFYEQGMARKDDVLKVDVKLKEAELAVLQAQNAVDLAGAYLENLTGQPVPENVTLQTVEIPQPESVNQNESLSRAYSQRLELKSLQFLKTALGFTEKIAQGEYWPSVAVYASYAYGKPGLNFVQDEWMNYWVAGIGLEWNLWNWGKTNSRAQQAKLKVRAIEENIAQIRQAIKLDVSQACLQVSEVIKRVELTGKIENQAEETYRIMENNYKNGVVSNSEFLDSQFDLTRARLQHVQAEIDYLISLANLKRADGSSFLPVE